VDTLKKELDQLRKKLKKEEKEKADAQVQKRETEDLLHKSTMALLGSFIVVSYRYLVSSTSYFCFFFFAEAADISANSVGKPPADAISMAIESGDLIRPLLQKNKAVLSRFHAMIFPKADQKKTLEQLASTFFVDTEGIIKVFKRTSRTYGALLAFQLLMGYGFKADMESLTTELPKDQDGIAIDLSLFSVSARKCAR
jgi:hypothetical protein